MEKEIIIMGLINKILISIILMCVGGIFYVSYNFIRFMELVTIIDPDKSIKEMMIFFVYVILFSLIISTSAKLLLKIRKHAREDKWSAKTPIPGVA